MKKLIVNQYVVEYQVDYRDMHFIVKQEYSSRGIRPNSRRMTKAAFVTLSHTSCSCYGKVT